MSNRINVETIDNTEEALKSYANKGWAHSDYYITKEQLEEVMNGKLIAIFDGESTFTIKLNN